jgi:hypothetical protein
MVDKQEILALALTDLVQSLVNPPCLDGNGTPVANQPASGLDACPAGSQRAYAAVTDIHVGVISSSIGGHGADVCPNIDNNSCPSGTNTTNNDRGHLLSRTAACGGGTVPTYENKGFLAWDPAAKLNPPGESDPVALAQNFKDIVIGAGQIGCGYESQLESWYRFLVDPEPYETISILDNKATPQGIDEVLLAQRADFLRPDSMLVIVNLSDENDCSTREYGQYFYAGQLKNGNGTQFHLPRPRSECATDPNDPCCKSCGQAPGNCPVDPTCVDGNGSIQPLNEVEDPSNLRCFDQKRRFGIDFLYPIERYVQALTSPTVVNRIGDLVPNPIFSGGVRDPALVTLTSIVGVPWQDIARDPNDLGKGFKSAVELQQPVAGQASAWDVIIGDPANYVAPADPLMIESIDPRSGSNPITNDALVTSQNPLGNSINGHEYAPSPGRDDLQYACIMNIVQARDCSNPSVTSCDCKDANNDNPLCAPNPNNGGQKTLQVQAKAYPGTRELSVVKATQGVAASICAKQVTNPAAADYAYRPAVRAIIERMQPCLKAE